MQFPKRPKVCHSVPFCAAPEWVSMRPMLDSVLTAIDQRRAVSLDGLRDFLRIPSVSTKPEHKPDMLRCAQWLADQIRAAGLTTEIAETGGHPAVLAKNQHKPNRPTVLIYGHYDVQPP